MVLPLKQTQVDLLCSASETLLQPGLGLDNFQERAYEFLVELVPCEFIAFGALDTQAGTLDIGADREVQNFQSSMESLGQLMSKYDLYNWNPSVNGGEPFTRSDFFSARQFKQTDIYAEVYKPMSIDDHCAVHVPGVEGEIAFFGIERAGNTDYTDDERGLLKLAQSLLGSARRLAKSRGGHLTDVADPPALVRAGLTNREAEVLALIAEGKSNEEISILLRIEVYTVKDHVKRIYLKTGAPNRLSATLWALRATQADQTRSTISHLPRVMVPVSDWRS
ncbi:MAG: response regulator transcription factor [Puniceicoccales bacterium]